MPSSLYRLSGLLDFEAAARHGSFRLAAAELHKTPSALSQQIKQLEASLGLQLFVRHPRHVAITAEGRELAVSVQRLLGELRGQVQALRAAQDPSRLRVSATHSFAMKWLVPRLHRFTEQHPWVDIRVEASDQPADLDDGGCDVALRYGPVGGEPLAYEEHWIAALSPTLAAAGTPMRRLLRLPLLHEDDTAPWLSLLTAEGLPASPHLDFSRSFSHGGLLVQAAVAGQGLALLPFALAQEDLERGRLLRIAAAPLAPGWGYRVLGSSTRREAPAVLAFSQWIAAEFALTRAACEQATAAPAPSRARR